MNQPLRRVVMAALLTLSAVGCGGKYIRAVGGEKVDATPDRVLRGGYLVNQVCACGACHTVGSIGGAGVQIERRYGRFVNGAFDPLAGNGGSLRQLFSLGNFNNPAFHGGPSGNPTLCQVPVEVEPATATVHNVGRLVTPLFGLGLVDAMPDSFFDAIAAAEPAATRGIARRVSVLLPNIHPVTGAAAQTVGSTRVARFGWKSAVSTLLVWLFSDWRPRLVF